MASEYDGSIKLGVQLNAKDVKASAKDLKDSLDQALSSMDGKKLDKNMQSTKNSMQKLVDNATKLENKINELESTQLPTDDYKEVSEQIEKANNKFNDLLYKQQEMQRLGKDHGKAWNDLSDKIDEVGNEIRYAEGELQDLVDTGKAFKLGSETGEFDNYVKKLDDVNSRMRIMKQRVDEQQISQLKASKGWRATGIVLNTLGTDIKKAVTHLKQLVLNLAKAVKASVINGFKKLGSAVAGVGKSASNSEFSFKRLFRTMLAYGLGINTITSLFSKLRNSISAGLQNFAEMDNGINIANSTLSEFTSSLNYLRNSVAAAFMPILQVVQPILTGFIDRLASAVGNIGAFIRSLQGFSTYTKAIKVQKNFYEEKDKSSKATAKDTTKTKNNTKAHNANTKAIKDNSRALKKQKDTLAGFDDLDVLGKEEDNSNSLGLDPTALQNIKDVADPLKDTIDDIQDGLSNLDNAFKEHAVIPEWISDLAQKIKEFIAQNDWYGLGAFLAEKFNGLLKIVDNWFNDVLRPEGVKWAGRIAELLNGLVSAVDWELLGKTIADGINAVFDIINTFLTTFDFLAFGARLGEGIKSWFENIDWALIGQTFANKWNALIHTIQGIVTTPGLFATIGTSIGTFLKNAIETIDIDGLVTVFISLFNGIFEMLQAFLDTLPFQGLAEKIYNGLNRMIHGINWIQAGKTLSDLVIQLLDVFMLVAEQTDWEGFGQAIGDFLGSIDWAGILGRVGKILWQVFSGIIKGLFSTDAGKVFLGIVAGVEGLKVAFALGAGILLPAVKKVLIDKLVQILITEGVGGIFPAMATAVTSGLSGILSFITGIGPAITGAISSILGTITSAVSGFVAFLFTPQGLIIAAVAAVLTLLVVLIVNNWDSISEFLGKCGEWLGKAWEWVVNGFKEMGKGIVDELKATVNIGIQMVEDFVNGIIAGVNFAINALNSLSFDVPDWVPIIGGQHVGFNIPNLNYVKIPRLAQGAVIPPNKQFLAMLGDQSSGTNIEAPLDTIVEAFREVVGNMQVQNTGYSEMTLDGQTFARLATPYIISELGRKGYNVSILEA